MNSSHDLHCKSQRSLSNREELKKFEKFNLNRRFLGTRRHREIIFTRIAFLRRSRVAIMRLGLRKVARAFNLSITRCRLPASGGVRKHGRVRWNEARIPLRVRGTMVTKLKTVWRGYARAWTRRRRQCAW